MSAILREWGGVFLVFWVFMTVFGHVKKDDIVKLISGLMGMMFGLIYLSSSFLIGLSMVFLNFYLIYDAIN